MAQGNVRLVEVSGHPHGYNDQLAEDYTNFVDTPYDGMDRSLHPGWALTSVWGEGCILGIPGAMRVPRNATPNVHYSPDVEVEFGHDSLKRRREQTVGGPLTPIDDPYGAWVSADRWLGLKNVPKDMERLRAIGAEAVGAIICFKNLQIADVGPYRLVEGTIIKILTGFVALVLDRRVIARFSFSPHARNVAASIRSQFDARDGKAPRGYTEPLEPLAVAEAIYQTPIQNPTA